MYPPSNQLFVVWQIGYSLIAGQIAHNTLMQYGLFSAQQFLNRAEELQYRLLLADARRLAFQQLQQIDHLGHLSIACVADSPDGLGILQSKM